MTEIKGYKAIRLDGMPEYGRRRKPYADGGLYHAHGELRLCGNGLHFCTEMRSVYTYYNPRYVTRVFEVVAYGHMATDGVKCCVKTLRFGRELTPRDIVGGLLSAAQTEDRAARCRPVFSLLARLVSSLAFGPWVYICAKDHDLLARAAERRLAFVEAFLELGTDSLMRSVFIESLSLHRLRSMRRKLKAEAARSSGASAKENVSDLTGDA